MKINSVMHTARKLYSAVFPKHLIVDLGKHSVGALTFDDGPCPGNTEKIIEILQKYNIKATFFLSGEVAEKYPELVRLIFTEGHQLANHGYYHRTINDLGAIKYIEGVHKVHSILEAIVNSKLKKVFRPPYGEMKPSVTRELIKEGYQFALWSYDTRDSYLKSDSEIVEHFKENAPRRNEIFLMHDDYAQTTLALPDILKYLGENGYKLSRLDATREI